MAHSNFQRTAMWLEACGKEKLIRNLSVQIGCDFEEQAEFLECLSLDSFQDQETLNKVAADLHQLGSLLKKGLILAGINEVDREDALDALCDREVTGNGVAYLADFDKESADQAVLDANDAKLVNGKPVILQGGKIGKPEGWTPANLKAFV